ncbi:glucokinase [Cognatishimia sp.]|uniref:glucokinase n=1 Tax=Cognatishimia sp. TaxID=2211648 RepID=UPI003511ED9E
MRLVADIGGTNTRLAFVSPDATQIGSSRSFQNAQFDSFESVLAAFLGDAPSPEQLVVAMAGPVVGNRGRLTNLDWVVDGSELSARFDGASVHVINDLTALGYAALRLAPNQVVPIVKHPAPQSLQKQALVVGIGTGFNVSPVVSVRDQTICPAVEAGHTSMFTSISTALDQIAPDLSAAFPTVEALFSGRGRRLFLSHVTGQEVARVTPFIAKQGQADNAAADAALDHYARLIGVLIAELKVAYLPTDGVFLAGGVARSSLTGNRAEICAQEAMRENAFVKITPSISIIDDDAAALIGCAALG